MEPDQARARAARPRTRWSGSFRRWLPVGVPLIASAVVYAPITEGFFSGDDFLHLQSTVNDPILHFVLQPAAGHVLILRNALFYVFYGAFGADPWWWLSAVLLTHLINVGGLYAVILRLTGSWRLGCFGATVWGIAPANEGTLGWYSVYGHAVVGTILLVLLYRVACRLDDPAPLPLREVLLWSGLLVLAGITFGVGIGIALVFPLVSVLLFPGARAGRGTHLLLVLVVLAMLGGYWALHHFYQVATGMTLETGILTLIGMLRDWQNAALMLGHLLAVGVIALLGNFWLPIATYPRPLAYVVLALFTSLFVAGLVRTPSSSRRLLLALACIAFGAYAIVAAGRGVLAAALNVPASGAIAPRYHYVGMMALCLILCVLLGWLGELLPLGRRGKSALLAAWGVLAAGLYARTDWQINRYARERTVTQSVIAQIQEAIDTTPPGQRVTITNRPFPAAYPRALFAGWAGIYTIFFPETLDPRVEFIESDPVVLALARPGSRLATVLIPQPIPPAS